MGSAGKTSAELPCRRCAGALGRSCCQPGPGERLATLTATDVERIRGATGLRRERFVDEEPFGPEEIRAYQALRPAWTGYFDHTTVRWGLKAEHGACVLLGPRGCTLEPESRPTACLLYPFEPTESGWGLAVERSGSVAEARASGEPRCLAVEEAHGRGALLRTFGIDVQTLTALAKRLREEVRAHPHPRAPVKGTSVR